MPVDEAQFGHVRVPQAMTAQLKALARQNRRSLQAEGLLAIEEYLGRSGQLQQPTKKETNHVRTNRTRKKNH